MPKFHNNILTNREITVTSSTDGDYDGDVVYFGGTTSMTIGTIYHYKSDGTWEAADAAPRATPNKPSHLVLSSASASSHDESDFQ